MTTQVYALGQHQSLPLAEALMQFEHIRHIPVVDAARRVIGVVSQRDVLASKIGASAPMRLEEREALELTIPIAAVMRTAVWSVAPDAPAVSAARLMRDHRFGCLPVVQDGVLVGIVTETDLLGLITELLENPVPTGPPRVEAAMSLYPVTIRPETTVADARDLMRTFNVRHLPVVTAEGHVTAVVSERDLAVAAAVYRGGDAAASVAVGLLGAAALFRVALDAPLDEVLLAMAANRHDAAVVLEGSRLLGIVTTVDACRLHGELLRAARR